MSYQTTSYKMHSDVLFLSASALLGFFFFLRGSVLLVWGVWPLNISEIWGGLLVFLWWSVQSSWREGAVAVWSAESSSSQLPTLFRFRFLSGSLDSYFQARFTRDNLLGFPIIILLACVLRPLLGARWLFLCS